MLKAASLTFSSEGEPLASDPSLKAGPMGKGENTMTTYNQVPFNGYEVFYREAGPKDAPTIVLLHGFPSSSHMFRELIPRLAALLT